MKELRRYRRLQREYHMEYGPFSTVVANNDLRPATLKNIGGGGVLFCSGDTFAVGTQLYLKIHIAGWAQQGSDVEKTSGDEHGELLIKAIAEVVRSDYNGGDDSYLVGAKFLGHVRS